MKLHQRLNLRPAMWDVTHKIEAVEIAQRVDPNWNDFTRAGKKHDLPYCRHLLSLAYYYSDELGLVREHASQCIVEMEEFFFGEWREQFVTPEKTIKPSWWRSNFTWMRVFEAAVLWGTVLGKWDFLKRVGEFPEPDSFFSDSYRAIDRDSYIAWGAFLRGATADEMAPLLELVQSGRSKPCKLVLALLRAGLARDTAGYQKALVAWLTYYRREEFPKEKITKKISIEGTFFVHWAEKEGVPVNVPPEFVDHIVRIS